MNSVFQHEYFKTQFVLFDDFYSGLHLRFDYDKKNFNELKNYKKVSNTFFNESNNFCKFIGL